MIALLLFVSLRVDFNIMCALVGFFATFGGVCVVLLQLDVDRRGIVD